MRERQALKDVNEEEHFEIYIYGGLQDEIEMRRIHAADWTARKREMSFRAEDRRPGLARKKR